MGDRLLVSEVNSLASQSLGTDLRADCSRLQALLQVKVSLNREEVGGSGGTAKVEEGIRAGGRGGGG